MSNDYIEQRIERVLSLLEKDDVRYILFDGEGSVMRTFTDNASASEAHREAVYYTIHRLAPSEVHYVIDDDSDMEKKRLVDGFEAMNEEDKHVIIEGYSNNQHLIYRASGYGYGEAMKNLFQLFQEDESMPFLHEVDRDIVEIFIDRLEKHLGIEAIEEEEEEEE